MSKYTHALFVCSYCTSLLFCNFVEMCLQINLKLVVALATVFCPKVTWYSATVAAEQFLQQFAFHVLMLAFAIECKKQNLYYLT